MKKRLAVVDWLKAFCAIDVIVAHSIHSKQADQTNIFYLLVIENAVPVFMILSGLTFALKYHEYALSGMYVKPDVIKKFVRFTIPMLFAYFAYLLYMKIQGDLSFINAVKVFITCDYGKGAYYYALMIEFIFIAPLIFVVIRILQGKGVFVIAGINLIYEILCRLVSLPVVIYRVLIFRYLTMIACGMYAFFLLKKKDRLELKWYEIMLVLIAFCIGVFYKLLPHFGYTYKLFISKLWGRTSMISALYIFPLVFLVLYLFIDSKYVPKINSGAVEHIGQASYHILYVQMVYYVYRPLFDKYVFDIKTLGMPIEMLINLCICLLFGVLFYHIDNKFVTGKIIHAINLSRKA